MTSYYDTGSGTNTSTGQRNVSAPSNRKASAGLMNHLADRAKNKGDKKAYEDYVFFEQGGDPKDRGYTDVSATKSDTPDNSKAGFDYLDFKIDKDIDKKVAIAKDFGLLQSGTKAGYEAAYTAQKGGIDKDYLRQKQVGDLEVAQANNAATLADNAAKYKSNETVAGMQAGSQQDTAAIQGHYSMLSSYLGRNGEYRYW